jgi:hypothetical protein
MTISIVTLRITKSATLSKARGSRDTHHSSNVEAKPVNNFTIIVCSKLDRFDSTTALIIMSFNILLTFHNSTP